MMVAANHVVINQKTIIDQPVIVRIPVLAHDGISYTLISFTTGSIPTKVAAIIKTSAARSGEVRAVIKCKTHLKRQIDAYKIFASQWD